jgi:hypothetical protein
MSIGNRFGGDGCAVRLDILPGQASAVATVQARQIDPAQVSMTMRPEQGGRRDG